MFTTLWQIPFTFQKYLKAKEEEELWKLKYLFHHAKIQSSKEKILLKKETKILQDIIINNSIK